MSLLGELFRAIFSPAVETDRSAGSTEESATPLKRVLPLLCPYERLEDDIKYNFEQNPEARKVFNYRTFDMGMPVEYPVVITTFKDPEGECSCDYTLMGLAGDNFWIFYNIYEFFDVELFLQQIRRKEDGVYVYSLSEEVRQKLPTFCKLMGNAVKNDKKPEYGLPFITFIDAAHKYPLLGAWFHESQLNKEGDMDKLHIALWKILTQMLMEMERAGILNQTARALAKSFVRMATMLYRLN